MQDEGSGWGYSVFVPALKLVEAERDNAKLDATMFTGVGAGISYTVMKGDTEVFSASPLSILVSGDTNDGDAGFFDISYLVTLTFYKRIVIGCGYDFGEVENRSRLFGVVGIGMWFN